MGTRRRRRGLFHHPRLPSVGPLRKKPMLAKRPLASPTRITRAAATEALRSSRPVKARATSSGLETQKHEQRKSKAPTKGVAHSHARVPAQQTSARER